MNSPFSNPATLWAEIFIDELYRAGLRHICISPGSRSTPLTLAATAHSHLKHSIHLDERSAAFFALGLALESRKPAALLCTSGTAAAEYFPAIIEASQSEIPILVLTADRPPELRHSGANQTIDQIKLYGNYVRWSVDAPLPENNPSPRLLRSLRALSNRALAMSLGQLESPGPVHINFPFRKPLEPTAVVDKSSARDVWTRIQISPHTPKAEWLADVGRQIQTKNKGVIVAGPRCPHGGFASALTKLSAQTGYPILADPLSGLRFGEHIHNGTIIAGYSAALRTHLLADAQPKVILRFGATPISQPLSDFLEYLPSDVPQIGITEHGFWSDPTYTLSDLIVADPLIFVEELNALLDKDTPQNDWAKRWRDAEAQVWNALHATPDFEGKIVVDALRSLPSETCIFVANSLPIRHVDEWLPAQEQPLRIYANRGASGIDGTISTALGIAKSSDAPTLLLTGDLSFFHDQNGLQALLQGDLKITILLINNQGGGIFHRLPISKFDPPFDEAFITPHNLDFSLTAQQYGLIYEQINAENAAKKVAASLASPKPHLLELRTDSAHGEIMRRELLHKLAQA